jgi:hypothetical protein
MIALEADSQTALLQIHQKIDHRPAIGSSVDHVAEDDNPGRSPGCVLGDLAYGRPKQIGATVNIADSVGDRCGAVGGPGSKNFGQNGGASISPCLSLADAASLREPVERAVEWVRCESV